MWKRVFRMSAASLKASVAALVCIGIFVVASIQDHAGSSKGARGPVMRVSEKIHRFGEISTWEMMEHTFAVFNDGETVLRIERVSPD
jgi:hypothetical protein